jgi:chromate reductase
MPFSLCGTSSRKRRSAEEQEEKSMANTFRILGFAGSLRKGSYNRSLLRAALELLPPGVELEIFDLEGIPPYNQDLEQQLPAKVRELKAKVRASDALLIATPEYNYSIPGVLKNAIDWASRPYGDNSFEDKAVAFIGASIGMIGTARAQYHLRQSSVFLNMHPLNSPEVMVPHAQDRIKDGKVTDPVTRELIRELLEGLVSWAVRLRLGASLQEDRSGKVA